MIISLFMKKSLGKLCYSKHFLRLLKNISTRSGSLHSSRLMTGPFQSKMAGRPISQDQGQENKLLFKFGIISDVQYADIDDRLNYEGTVLRYYRNSVGLLRKAVDFWKHQEPDFILQLGDIIEGNHVRKQDRERTLETVLNVCKELGCYICHLWGNHEFYLYSREELAATQLNSKLKLHNGNSASVAANCNTLSHLKSDSVKVLSDPATSVLINNVPHTTERKIDSGNKYYFTFSPHPKYKFIAIDSYDVSICGRVEGEPEYEEARKILTVKNTNDNWNSPYGLKEPHFVKFNGGLSKDQLEWLDKELELAEEKQENVVIISHIPIHPKSTIFLCNLWNFQDVLDVIWNYSCVKLCLCGHSHEDGDFVDHKGIQHIVFPAVLECNEQENAFANVFVFENKIKIFGYGKVKSFDIDV